MHVSALLEFDAVPLDTGDEVAVLLDITAPERSGDEERPPSTLQVVLDRSGSMHSGGRLAGAVRALTSLVDRLDPADRFGVVVFSDQAQALVPAGPLTDKDAVKERIRALRAGGSTDLSSGLMRGVQEARRASGDQGATLLLISDGHANQGVTDPARLAEIARTAYGAGVATTTVGYGLGYDEALLGAVSDGGAGDALFAEDPDTAVGLLQGEVEHLLAKTAQAASLRVRVGAHVRSVDLLGGLPADRLPDGDIVVELGDFYSGERRRLMLRLDVAGISDLGPATVATLEVTYVDPAELDTYTVTMPVPVNVVPGGEAAQRIADPAVSTEKAYQKAQEAKRRASEALRRGDRGAAAAELENARQELNTRIGDAPEDMARQVADQVAELDLLARSARTDDAARAAKATYMSGYSQSRKRGSRQQAYGTVLPSPPDVAAPGGRTSRGRLRASLLGLSVGDGFGDWHFSPAVARNAGRELPPAPWRWTDDTLMACSVADVLLRSGRVDSDALARSFAEHFDSGRKYGAATLELLERVRQGEHWKELAEAQFGGGGSWGNGAAMRVAPLGAYFAGDLARARDEAALSARVTHTHEEGVAGAVAVAVAASAAAGIPDATGEQMLEASIEQTPGGQVREGLIQARNLMQAPSDTAARTLGTGSRVSAPDTVPFALWAAATRLDDFAATVRTCAEAGGDRDTTSAIAGGVAAARTGAEGIPTEWRARVEPLPEWVGR
ncbi:ADP-ribosylglycohydrolase family protein [Nocardiopsis sp. RSe5-2]|uniref:ADP-ribosylglycohydrolase family protein n=1 Tax=Nocardiopsis endophytica TaxID=3018445 RepID=A0ABT4U5I5_9ACTN|nr:ADP-ribosylglycohydrolase family protein [Nocardiopsis endophytica]MDA2811700.1 ADP-ribosylglycohydrolase family protein [Nocardiopsis endophytica]